MSKQKTTWDFYWGRPEVSCVFSGQRALHRNICYELLTVTYGKTSAFGMPEGSEIVYDCKATMYTSAPINLLEVLIASHYE
jgi:hypothetical protein